MQSAYLTPGAHWECSGENYTHILRDSLGYSVACVYVPSYADPHWIITYPRRLPYEKHKKDVFPTLADAMRYAETMLAVLNIS